MSLYHKYRPKNLESIRENEEIVSSLENYFSNTDKMPHAFLFHGGTGCGKTTFIRIIKNSLNISDSDYTEIDSAQFNGIDTIRELRQSCRFKPIESTFRLYALDEVHMLSSQAQEGLLKILEDTPKHVIFCLATTEPNKLKPTLRGRCQQYQVNPLSDKGMEKLLYRVVKKEKEVLESSVYTQIIQDALGHPRNALQILDKVLSVEPEKRLEAAKQSAVEYSESIELCRALLANSSWKKVSEILSKLKQQDAESIRRHVLGYAQSVLLKADNMKAGLVLEEFLEPTYNSGFPQIVYAAYRVIKAD